MSGWKHLIEARIRDWQERRSRGEDRSPARGDDDTAESLETQLFQEIVALRKRAISEPDPRRKRDILKSCDDLRLRLSVVLEKQELYLLARDIDQRIEAALKEIEDL